MSASLWWLDIKIFGQIGRNRRVSRGTEKIKSSRTPWRSGVNSNSWATSYTISKPFRKVNQPVLDGSNPPPSKWGIQTSRACLSQSLRLASSSFLGVNRNSCSKNLQHLPRAVMQIPYRTNGIGNFLPEQRISSGNRGLDPRNNQPLSGLPKREEKAGKAHAIALINAGASQSEDRQRRP